MPSSAPQPTESRVPFQAAGRALAANLAAWAGVVLLHGAAAWSDAVRRGRTPGFLAMLGGYAEAYAPWVPLSAALYLLHTRARHPWRWVVPVSLAFFPLELAYQAMLILRDTEVTPGGIVRTAAELPAVFRLVDFGLLLATNAVVVAVVALRTRRAAAEQERALQAENIRLRLALEQQRLQGLRAQLEPHFLHNALNAISGLVRSQDRGLALTALQRLSRLLRYATTAVAKDWVPLADEVAFLQEYLALQQLRFGARLAVRYEGLDLLPAEQESPPLLLQPLAENAVRHGLERSNDPTSISVRVATAADRTTILVSNTMPANAPPNPGLGVGLATLRDRLAAAYRGLATLTTAAAADRFDAELVLPSRIDD
ncbi:MAG: sensor histidine kinase [Gemmatimonadales bacterium]